MRLDRQGHLRLYRRLVNLTPGAHRSRHGDQQVQLFGDLLDTGRSPWRLWARAIPDLLAVIALHSDRRSLMALTAKALLIPLSLLEVAAGSTLATVSLLTAAIPAWVALAAAAIVVQGVYTLAWSTGRVWLPPQAANLLFLVGELAAALLGTTALGLSIAMQLSADHAEYGPLAILSLVTVHGALGIVAVGLRPDPYRGQMSRRPT